MRRALEHMQMFDLGCNRRDHLGCAGTAADDRHAFTAIVVAVIPIICVKSLALKAIHPGKVGDDRLTQWPGSIDQELGSESTSGAGVHQPMLFRFVPLDALDIGPQFHALA